MWELARAIKEEKLDEIRSLAHKWTNFMPMVSMLHMVNADVTDRWCFHFWVDVQGKYTLFGTDAPEDTGLVICKACKQTKTIRFNTALKFDFYSSMSLQNFLLPVVGSTWNAREIKLRIPELVEWDGCDKCKHTEFVWIGMYWEPNLKPLPLLLPLKRNRPEVEPVIWPVGPVPIPLRLYLGSTEYRYVGWTARHGDIQMVPWILSGRHKMLNYSWVPGGLVQEITSEKAKFPKDPRHVDMLLYVNKDVSAGKYA